MATNTSRLGLLKKDTATDGNDTFNIKTMLNDNWDKIDAKVATLGADGKVPADQLSISVSDASTTQKGVVMLEDSVTSTSITKAATPKSVKTVNDALDAHKTDLASQENGKGASLIGIEDSANQFTATTVEGALTELFTSVSNGKSTVANAITQKGQTASGSDTFAQLATAISNIKVGKLTKEGTVTSTNSTKSFITGQGTSSNNYYMSVDTSLLGFEPSVINIVKSDKSYSSPIIWQKENFVDNSSYKANYSMGTIFRIPFVNGILDLPVNTSNSQYNWYAYE